MKIGLSVSKVTWFLVSPGSSSLRVCHLRASSMDSIPILSSLSTNTPLHQKWYNNNMKPAQPFTAVIEQGTATGYYVAYVPDLPGAHTQAISLGELQQNLKEVV